MPDDLLDEYLDRPVVVRFTPAASPNGKTEGVLRDYSPAGLLLEQEDDTLVFIPYAAIRMVEMKPRPSFWQRLTGIS